MVVIQNNPATLTLTANAEEERTAADGTMPPTSTSRDSSTAAGTYVTFYWTSSHTLETGSDAFYPL